MTGLPTPLVSTGWLADNLSAVKIIDASWRMPGGGVARDDYEKRHIPGAVFFDIDAIADTSTDLPHMLPSPEAFARAVGAMGIGEKNAIVVYDDQGIFSAPRVWWTLRVMGHERVAVVDGGLKKWLAEKRAVASAETRIEPARYEPALQSALVRDSFAVRAVIDNQVCTIIDARASDRFLGHAPEPRAGLVSGAMPGAKNTPFNLLINEDGTMKSPPDLKDAFTAAGVDLSRPVVTTCGSGVTAAVLALALESLGHREWSLYDGSWAEWGKEDNDRNAYPIVVAER